MSMFDYVKSSYPLGEAFTGELQTKDIEPCFGGTMAHYWISPAGELYQMDYINTQTLVPDPSKPFFPYRYVPNGNHGKVKALNLTKSVEVYPASFDGTWKDWPTLTLFFVNGQLTDTHESTKAST
jgi:hypothetical protein